MNPTAILPVWREQTHVRAFETDFNNTWKPAAFFNAMQEAAANHARNLGFDYPEMIARGMIWVLTRLKIRFLRFPTLPEAVHIRTFPRGIQQKIFFTRDFLFDDSEGKPLAAATSAWLLIDPQRRRMLLPNSLPGALPRNEGLVALDEILEKIPLPAEMIVRTQRQAGYSAVDLMNHVNNARYIEWICDCFPPEHHRRYRLAWLQINYNNEVRLEETVTLAVGESAPLRYAVSGSLNRGETRAFEAELGWQSIHQPSP